MRRGAHCPRVQPLSLRWVGFALTLALAGGATNARAAPGSGPYRVAGTVVNAVTGEPAARVLVSLFGEDMHTVAAVVTDAEGRFFFSQLAQGKYPLSASKRGYRTAFYDDHDGFNTAIVTGPDENTEHLIFRLSPGATLSGVITEDGGDPVEGARVMLFAKVEHRGGAEKILASQTLITDDRGAYEFTGLAGGDYLIAVSAEPWYALHPPTAGNPQNPDAVRSQLDVAYPTTYFDSTTEEASAATISLVDGSRQEADIHLSTVPALHITVPAGQSPEGRGQQPTLQEVVFGVTMPAANVGFNRPQSSVAEFDGVAPGHYELRTGDPPRLVEMEATESRAVGPDEGAAMVPVAGVLRMADGSKPPEEVHLYLTSEGDRERPGQATTAHGGRFAFAAVPSGQWIAVGEAGGKLFPAVGVGVAGSAQGSVIAVRDRPVELTLTLGSGAAGRIDGFARKDGKGFAGALIELIPGDPANLPILGRRDQSDSDGSFSLTPVVPGRYTIVAIEDGWDLDWSDPHTMARYLPRGRSVTVTDIPGTRIRLNEPVPVQPR